MVNPSIVKGKLEGNAVHIGQVLYMFVCGVVQTVSIVLVHVGAQS